MGSLSWSEVFFPHLDSPVNVYEMRHTVDGTPLYSSRKDGVAHNMLKVAFFRVG